MDQQRYTQRCDDYDSDHSLLNLDTNIHLEKHGAIVYTHAVFKMFQEEVKASISCSVADFDKENNVRIIFVEDAESNRTFKVTFNLSTTDAECACKLFERIGLDSNGNVIEDSNMAQSDNCHACKLWAEFSATVGVLKTLPTVHMDELASLLVEFQEKLYGCEAVSSNATGDFPLTVVEGYLLKSFDILNGSVIEGKRF
ncbi:protein FAR-RED ELONGATED HYPOCOTYL 3-like [Silene latifolia]|uniref:protein FAR-RED ELONGATED HYPOCOTYL 3-like n=1 Tax=Silene latifolia TaxID=37657 RepID=UPI003D787E6E